MASPKQFKTAIVITGNADGAIKVTKATERQLGKLENRGKSVSAQLSNIAGTGIKYGAALAGAAAAGAAVMIKRQLDIIDSTAKVSDKLGIATEKLTALRLQAELTGASQKALDMGLQRMTRRVAEAARGTGEAQEAIKQLGLDAKELAQLSPDQQFAAIADAMEGVSNQGERVRLSFKLFDSEGVALVNTLRGGSAAALEAQQFTEQWGLALTRVDASKIEQANDAMTLLSRASEGFWKQLTVRVSPAITKAAEEALGLAEGYGTAAELADAAVDTIVGGLDSLANAAVVVGAVMAARLYGPAIQGYGAMTAAQVANTAARLKSNFVVYEGARAEAINAAALKKSALAEAAKARATVAAAAAEVESQRAVLGSIKSEMQLEMVRHKAQISQAGRAASQQRMIAIRGELALATAALTKAEAAHVATLNAQAAATARATAATASYTSAATAATLSARALAAAGSIASGAMAMLGGPVGVAVVAAAGLYAFREELGLVDTTARTVANAVSDLSDEIRDLDRVTTEANIRALEAAKADLERRAKDIRSANLRGTGALKNRGGILGFSRDQLHGESEALTEVESSLAMLTGQLGAFNARLADIDAENEARRKRELEEEAEKNKEISARIALLKEENALLKLGYTLEEAKFIAAYASANAVTQALMRQQREQKGIIDGYKEAETAAKKLSEAAEKSAQELASQVDAFLSDGFDSKAFEAFDQLGKSMYGVVDALNEMVDRQSAFNELKAAEGITAEQVAKINARQAQNQISAYGDIAGAAKGFFSEGSKGYEALQKAEQTFRLFEIAMATKSLAAKMTSLAVQKTETIGTYALMSGAAYTQAQAEGLATVAGAGKGLPAPLAIAAMASVAAALASFGVSIGGGSGVSAPTAAQTYDAAMSSASGTVLGSREASESLSESMDILAGLADSQLGYTMQMAQSLRNIEASFVGYSGAVAGFDGFFRGTNFGSITEGMFSDPDNPYKVGNFTTPTLGEVEAGALVDRMAAQNARQLADKGGVLTAAERSLHKGDMALARLYTNTVSALLESTSEAVDMLGLSISGSIAGIEIKPFDIDPRWDNEQVDNYVSAYFSALGDTIVGEVAPALEDFQQGGEGLLETLTRVAGETFVLRDAVDSLGLVAAQTPLELMSVADALGLAAGGLGDLTENVTNFLDFALSDSEQFERIQRQATALFDGLDMTLPATREEVTNFVRSLDLTTESGQQAFTAVTAASELLGEFFDQLEDYAGAAYRFDTALGLADGSKPLREALAGVGLNLDIVETAAAGGSVALQALFVDLTDTQKAGLEPFADAITALLPVSKDAAAILNERTQLETQLLQLQGNTAELRRREREAIDESNRALYDQIQALKDQQSAAAEATRAMEQMQGIAQGIREYLSGLAISEYQGNPLEQSNTAMQQFRALAQSALAGDAEAAQQLTGAASSALSLGEAAFASGAQFQALYSEVKNTLANVADSINIESYEEAMLRLQQEQIDALDALGNALTVELTATAKSEIEKLITFVTDTDQLPDDLKALALSAGGVFTKTVDFIAGQVLPVDLRNLALDTASTLTKTANFVVGSQLSDDLKRLALESSGDFIQTIDFVLGADLSHDNKLLALSTAGTLAKTVDFVTGQQLSPEIMELALAESNSIMTTVNAMLASDADVDAIALANLGDNYLSTTVTALLDSGSDQQAINLAIGVGGEIVKYVKALKASGYDYQAASIAQAYSSTITKTIQASGGQLNADQQAILNALNGESNVSLDGDVLLRTDATMRDLLKGISDSTVQTVGAITELKYRLDDIIGKAGLQNIYAKAHYETFQKTLGDRDRVRVMSDYGKSLSDDRLRKFAKGGVFTNSIVDSPTRFNIGEMGEAGPEAIMPLHKGPDGSLGVRAQSPAFDDRAIVAEIRSHRQETEHQTRLNAEAARQTVAELKRLNRRVADIEAELETARVVS
ncbi:hypothetical protein [Spongiibacter marinus]|uniref:hypothetical protein n=1 Tax=Spongiibacter marinus TaxID=354246 RepID=UPI0019609104|nr:hypothetical protein [Spongiibacter marinus]MBM7425067.1 hypothetical protein [Spongiibacter marinus]